MALDLVAIRKAIANQIQNGVARDVNIYGGYIPEVPMPPAIIVFPDTQYVDYHRTYSKTGMAEIRFRIRIFMPTGPGADGQMVLDDYLSSGSGETNSVIDAVTADLTFGGAVGNALVESCQYTGRVVFGQPNSQTPADAAELVLVCKTHPNP